MSKEIKINIKWSTEDIHLQREHHKMSKWTDDQAYEFLKSIHDKLHDFCVENGWDFLLNDLWDEEDGLERDMNIGTLIVNNTFETEEE